MPSIPLHLPNPVRGYDIHAGQNSLPQLLQTPSGLAILEIQGTINTPALDNGATTDADTSFPATSVGRIEFPDFHTDDPTDSTAWMKRVHLYVGRHQRLTGEVKKLSSPLAVIRRKPEIDIPNSGIAELEIAEIIYYKVLFSSRPEPVSE
ncbi:MAG: hypothetical protein Q9210_000698 [Variospora velana]